MQVLKLPDVVRRQQLTKVDVFRACRWTRSEDVHRPPSKVCHALMIVSLQDRTSAMDGKRQRSDAILEFRGEHTAPVRRPTGWKSVHLAIHPRTSEHSCRSCSRVQNLSYCIRDALRPMCSMIRQGQTRRKGVGGGSVGPERWATLCDTHMTIGGRQLFFRHGIFLLKRHLLCRNGT